MYHLIRVITHTILFFLRKKLGGFSWGRFRGRGSWWRPKKGGEFYWQKYKWHLIFNQKSVSHVLHVLNVFFFVYGWKTHHDWFATLFHIINLAVKANIFTMCSCKNTCMYVNSSGDCLLLKKGSSDDSDSDDEEPDPSSRREPNKFDNLCDGVTNTMAYVHGAMQEVSKTSLSLSLFLSLSHSLSLSLQCTLYLFMLQLLNMKDEMLKHALPPTLLIKLATVTGKVFRRWENPIKSSRYLFYIHLFII